RSLELQCLYPLLEEGHAVGSVLVSRSLDLRYTGQNYEITVPYEAGAVAALRLAFEERHRRLYGYATGESVECVNLRVTARVETDVTMTAVAGARKPVIEPIRTRHAFFPEAGDVILPLHERSALGGGASLEGPAVIEDEWSTIVVYPGQSATADHAGNLVIEVRS